MRQDNGSAVAPAEGLLDVWVSSSAAIAERAVHGGFAIVREAQGELAQRLLGTLDLIDATQQAIPKLARRVVVEADQLGRMSLDATQALTLGAIRGVRDTGHGMTSLAARTSSVLIRNGREVSAPS